MSADKLQNLIEEYEERSSWVNRTISDEEKETNTRLGDLWFNPENNTLYICGGKINGVFRWLKINDVDKIE
jgi:hypothetical protein